MLLSLLAQRTGSVAHALTATKKKNSDINKFFSLKNLN